jgi:hypothetical protein
MVEPGKQSVRADAMRRSLNDMRDQHINTLLDERRVIQSNLAQNEVDLKFMGFEWPEEDDLIERIKRQVVDLSEMYQKASKREAELLKANESLVNQIEAMKQKRKPIKKK